MANADLTRLLRAEKSNLSKRRRQIERELHKLTNELQLVRTRISHIEGLVGASNRNKKSYNRRPESESATDVAAAILEELGGQDLHYEELAREVKERSGLLFGKNPGRRLVAKLIRDDRFLRPFRKGHYALRMHHPTAKNVGVRKNRAL